jgi:uncharacterized membrane protein YczE
MNHYARLATVITRMLGALIALSGLMGIVYWLVAGFFLDRASPELVWQSARVLSAGIFVVAGMVVYAAGKPIGKLVGKGLDA